VVGIQFHGCYHNGLNRKALAIFGLPFFFSIEAVSKPKMKFKSKEPARKLLRRRSMSYGETSEKCAVTPK
jgi:hypothetical protein